MAFPMTFAKETDYFDLFVVQPPVLANKYKIESITSNLSMKLNLLTRFKLSIRVVKRFLAGAKVIEFSSTYFKKCLSKVSFGST